MKINLKNNGIPADAFEVLNDYLQSYFSMRNVVYGDGYTIAVTAKGEDGSDRFALIPKNNGALVEGTSLSSVFHGVGMLLRKMRFDGSGGFTPFAEKLEFIPEKSLRGMYFATHFHNYYHNAPQEKIYQRILLCALRGYNELLLWFDMHHYTSMQAPKAIKMVERLRKAMAFANKIGIGVSILCLANEGFASSPEKLRAHFALENGYHKIPVGNYGVEICPSTKEGIAEILRERRVMLSAFSDLKIDYVIYWPYDQGGCTCEKCAPWGANGFLRLYPHFRSLLAEMLPDAKLICSCWMFDHFTEGEWEGFDKAFSDGKLKGVDYVMAGHIPHQLPHVKDIKWISFPEISMYHCSPWGGFGASQIADGLTAKIGSDREMIAGGFPYSEGIFEDANEFMVAGWYSGEFSSNQDALRAYVAEAFCCEDEELYRAVAQTEVGLKREPENALDRLGVRYPIADTSSVDFVAKTFEKYATHLPEAIAKSDAFRLFYLRSIIDKELVAHNFSPLASDVCIEAMKEVDSIYYVTDESIVWVRTPVWRIRPDFNPDNPVV